MHDGLLLAREEGIPVSWLSLPRGCGGEYRSEGRRAIIYLNRLLMRQTLAVRRSCIYELLGYHHVLHHRSRLSLSVSADYRERRRVLRLERNLALSWAARRMIRWAQWESAEQSGVIDCPRELAAFLDITEELAMYVRAIWSEVSWRRAHPNESSLASGGGGAAGR